MSACLVRLPTNLARFAWNLGFHGGDTSAAWCGPWVFQILTRVFVPDCVVQDFGLVAGMVARSLAFPTVRIGTGYTCPPRSRNARSICGVYRDEGGQSKQTRTDPKQSRTGLRKITWTDRDGVFVPALLSVPSVGVRRQWMRGGYSGTLPLLDPLRPTIAHHAMGWSMGFTCERLARATDCTAEPTGRRDVLAYLKPWSIGAIF